MKLINKIQALLKYEFISNIVYTYSSKIILIILGLISNILITRSLGVAEYGNFIFVMTIVTMGMQFGSFGLHSANIYYVAKNKRLLGFLLKNSIAFSFVSGSIIVGIISIVYILYPKLFGVSSEVFVITMFMIPISLISLYSKNLLIGIGKIKLDNKITIYSKILLIVLLIAFALFKMLNIYNTLMISFVTLVVGLLFVYKNLHISIIYKYKISLKLFKNISKFGFKAYLSGLLAFLVFKSDLLFVNYYLSDAELSYYSLAVSFIDYIYILPVIIGTILFQKLSSIKNREKKYQMMKKVNSYFTIGYGIFLFIVYLFIEDFITILYGKDFIESVLLVKILLIAIFFMGIETIQVQYLNVIGFPVKIIYYWIISLVINIILIIEYINDFGLILVAISTVIAYFLIFILINMHIYKERLYAS